MCKKRSRVVQRIETLKEREREGERERGRERERERETFVWSVNEKDGAL